MVFGLLLLLVSLTTAQTAHKTFTCSFTLTNEPLFPSGSATGVLRFDWGRHKHDFTFAASSASAASSQQIYSYNSNGGYTSTTEQFLFYKTTACACSHTPLSTAQPPFLFDRTVITANTDGSFKPTNGNTGFTKLTFNAASGFIESAIDNTGKTYKFTGCADSTFTDTTWNPPAGCECGTPSDVVLVLDRSSSITADLFVLQKDFVTQLVNAFTYGPVATNLGITNFHTLSWDGPVNLRDGTTATVAKDGARKLACAPDGQCHVFGSAGTCCGSGTSISSGIINGVDMLVNQASKTDVRKGAAKVLIVFTDGAHGKPLLRVGDVLTLDALGKPQGTDGAFTAAQLTADIQYAVDYAKRKIPSIVIYAVAAGPTFNNAQLLTIASGDASKVFADRDWNKLSGFVNKLVSTSCTSSADITVNSCCAPNSCSAWCKNYKIVGGPTCADGNTASGDGCSATCTVEKGWTCPSTCAPVCGDSIILGAEKCDDGNTKPGDGCSATCTIEDGWSCPNPGKPCNAVCGDKKKAGSEQCDDGNILSGDGCSSTCILESGYDCATLGVPCLAKCGDSLKVGKEQCDDGNTKAGDGCSATCTIEEGYSCPDAPGRPCKDVDECKTYGCGTVATCTESGNTAGTTKVAIGKRVCTCPTPGYTVTKTTSVSVTLSGAATFAGCSGICGDSLIVKGEECDDGGVFSGDGCSSTCTREAGAVCPDPGLRCCLPLPMEPTEPIKCWNGYWVPTGQKRDE